MKNAEHARDRMLAIATDYDREHMAVAENPERLQTLEAAVEQFSQALTVRDGARMRVIKRNAVRYRAVKDRLCRSRN